MENINYLATIAAAVSAFLFGGLWYSPALFGKTWQREAGLNESHFKDGHGPLVFGVSFLMSLIAAFAFAMLLGPAPAFLHATGFGLLIGSCFVATSFAINYSFGGRSIKLFLIDGAYHVVQFALYGAIIGIWH